jgi:hypothetical protein
MLKTISALLRRLLAAGRVAAVRQLPKPRPAKLRTGRMMKFFTVPMLPGMGITMAKTRSDVRARIKRETGMRSTRGLSVVLAA